jgi:hypothetical protein
MLINGPINAIRLEGSINNINKIIYVFFDYHSPIGLQTECESYDSMNVIQYLYNLFKNTSKSIDFFLEIKQSFIQKKVSPFKNIYIQEIAKMYNKVKFNDKTKKDIKHNVRFHYLDIRDHLEKFIYTNISILYNSAKSLRMNKDIYSTEFHNILDSCTRLIYELDIYKKYFDGNQLARSANNNNEPKDMITYFLDKITKKYKNTDIIKQLKKTYFKDVIKHINICLDKLKELQKIVQDKEDYVYRYYDEKMKYTKGDNFNNYINIEELDNFVFYCDKLIEEINYYILYIFSKLTDIYFIRRFLDKDYITNAITYTGSAHSINYINLLVSYFDFKITHYSYSEEKDLDKLNRIAKTDIKLLDYTLHPQQLIQCSDLSSFPNDF